MQAATLRRLMVFGVCLLGVGALYLVPSVARAPDQGTGPGRTVGTPTARRSPAVRSPVLAPAPSITKTTPTTYEAPPQSSGPATQAAPEVEAEPKSEPEPPVETLIASPAASRTVWASSTPFVPGPPRDETPPSPVTALEGEATPDQLRLVWAASNDDAGVVSYRIWLNGYEVQTTVETNVTLDWFNNDDALHVVQVRAVDAAGNRSLSAATLLVSRPTVMPSPTNPPAGAPSIPPSTPAGTPTTPSPTPSRSAAPLAPLVADAGGNP